MQKKLGFIFVCFFTILSLNSELLNKNNLHFTYSFENNSVRARGMGKAFTAIADDTSAINWNPAGLSQLYLSEITYHGNLGFGDEVISDKSTENEFRQEPAYHTSFVGIALPIPSLDFGGFDPSDLAITFAAAYNRLDAYKGEITEEEAERRKAETIRELNGGLDAATVAASIKLLSALSIGVNYNYYTSSSDITIDNSSKPEFSYSGNSIDIGFMFRPNEVISIGTKLSLPKTIEVDMTNNPNESDGIYKYDYPLYSSFGIAFHSSSGLNLAFDYHNKPADNIDIYKNNIQINSPREPLSSFHFGLETISPQGATLRLGYYYEPTSRYINNLDNEYTQMVYHNVTTGLGFLMGQNFALDLSGEWKIQNQDIDETTYKRNLFNIGVCATYYIGK